MNKRIIAIGAATAITFGVFAAGANAWAKQHGHDKGSRMINKITKTLSLDEGQVEALKALHEEMRETHEIARPNQDLITSFKDLLSADTFDQTQALNMLNERVSAFQAKAPDVVNAAAVFLDGLSAEQKAELNGKLQHISDRHARHHNKR